MRVIFSCIAAMMVATGLSANPWSGVERGVLILGEVHDNPDHHALQARAVSEIGAKVVIFEMLTEAEAESLQGISRNPTDMAQAVQGFHWSNIADYADILAASPVIVGAAVPRDDIRAAFGAGAAEVFGPEAAAFGLDRALDVDELERRKTLQFQAHCEAMPLDMMGQMVEVQRLRDAHFARVVRDAIVTYGEPVVLITGNGHARTDWGVPRFLARVRPDLVVLSIGQGEDGIAPSGAFSAIATTASVPAREDPCRVFQ